MIILRSLLLFCAVSLSASGAIPQEDLKYYQDKAPEHLQIRITNVEKKAVEKNGHHSFAFTVHATVSKVIHSKSALVPGAGIVIRYSRPDLEKSPDAGDWPGTVKDGLRYEAYLKKDGDKNVYRPAAHSGSFVKIEAKDS